VIALTVIAWPAILLAELLTHIFLTFNHGIALQQMGAARFQAAGADYQYVGAE
jgi:hypothetical protein